MKHSRRVGVSFVAVQARKCCAHPLLMLVKADENRLVLDFGHTSVAWPSADKVVESPDMTPVLHISPHCAITTSCAGFSDLVRIFSIFLTVSKPSMTLPKTQCFPFRKGVGTVVMKN